ncbi:MAG: hypothetical protein M1835_005943 [Candelina submexicana]|nr:MAG: hypothetical protein M1835_005943 [Candelina submexicana]
MNENNQIVKFLSLEPPKNFGMAQSGVPDIANSLPHVKHSLEPYVKTRQEVLHIRRTLTAFLSSQITHIEEGVEHSHTFLLPCECTQDLHVPKELSGLRQAYLIALQGKRNAVKAYQAICKVATTQNQTQIILDRESRASEESKSNLGTYLDLLRQRRKYHKLQILQDYLHILSQKAPANAQYLDVERILTKLTTAPQPPADLITRTGHGDGSVDGPVIDAKLNQLKKTVLQSNCSLDSEENRLSRLKADAASTDNGTIDHKSTERRLSALFRVRAELIDWIEGELAQTGSSKKVVATSKKRNGSHRIGDHVLKHREDIKERYREYINARKTLLSTLSATTTPMAPSVEPAYSAVPSLRKAPDTPGPDRKVTAPLLLYYLEEHLLPISRSQKVTLQQRSQITTSLARQERSNQQAIDRLKEESHLLSAYPLLSDHPRFRNAAAALAKRFHTKHLTFDDQSTLKQECRVFDGARAWAFAAETARSANRAFVDEKLVVGRENLQSTSILLDEIRTLLGTPGDQSQGKAINQDDDAELWASKALVKRRSKTGQLDMNAGTSSYRGYSILGPWRKLDGKVGGLGSSS